MTVVIVVASIVVTGLILISYILNKQLALIYHNMAETAQIMRDQTNLQKDMNDSLTDLSNALYQTIKLLGEDND